MDNYFVTWRKTLSELNNFSCQVEFLQCKMRQYITTKKDLNINEYLKSLDQLLKTHERNLFNIESNKPNQAKISRKIKITHSDIDRVVILH
jgi:hypothetical protein